MDSMGAHIDTNGDSTLAAVSLIFIVLAAVGLGTVGAIVAIVSGSISIVINWPRFKERIKMILSKLKKDKDE
jgi:hypothetical protein